MNPSAHFTHRAPIPLTQNWFSDSGATHHIAPDLSGSHMLRNIKDRINFMLVMDKMILYSQSQYIHGILIKAGMLQCKPLSTSMATNVKFHKNGSPIFDDPSLYRQVVGDLQYITLTRPDISFVVNKAFTDFDWADNIDNHKSTGGYAIYFGPDLISWSSRKQRMVARSSTESEYKALTDAAAKLTWSQSLMFDLGLQLSRAPIL
ncbi:uncharacterized mitochondrial protein AtMg00810-like [Capsicum annuum]|uniref:uncharacterized mitochondrial protein AtMg00810-like n=1 Tax=Capsicum annuum TaxID=4072 RepID=UPI001FB154C4|nr:uncharacterized mitochondrial protein AtMg00810-like [Capsicum annuum]